MQDKNRADQRGWTPLHWAARAGLLDICGLVMDNEQRRIQHIAAREGDGNLQVCHLIMDDVQNKNPADHQGWTLLHEAAKRVQHKVCHLIMANVQDKDPANNFGATPLSLAKSFKSINHSATVKLFQKMLKTG